MFTLREKKRTRFDAKSFPCIFFGYDDAASAAILGKLPGMSILYSAHGRYNDEEFPCRDLGTRSWEPTSTYDTSHVNPSDVWFGPTPNEQAQDNPELPSLLGKPDQHPRQPEVRLTADPGLVVRPSANVQADLPDDQAARRSKRAWCPSSKALEQIIAGSDHAAAVDDLLTGGEDSVMAVTQASANPFFQTELAYATQDVDVPRTFAQVLRLPAIEKEKWIAACQRESESHLQIPSISGALKQEDWTQAPPVRLTWVFAKKDIYKARIVMLGQHMQEGIHFNDTHAPVPSVTAVRLILALTASEGRHLTQMDVKTAFLNAPIDIELDVLVA